MRQFQNMPQLNCQRANSTLRIPDNSLKTPHHHTLSSQLCFLRRMCTRKDLIFASRPKLHAQDVMCTHGHSIFTAPQHSSAPCAGCARTDKSAMQALLLVQSAMQALLLVQMGHVHTPHRRTPTQLRSLLKMSTHPHLDLTALNQSSASCAGCPHAPLPTRILCAGPRGRTDAGQ